MNNGKAECTFLWFIENYSYCWHKNGEELTSPEFDGLEGKVWTLGLYPRGNINEYKGYISLFLYRTEDDDGPDNFPLTYELSILAADGSALFSKELRNTFKKGPGFGWPKIDEVLLRRKTDYIPQDTLNVRCKLWSGEGNIQVVKLIKARTRIGIEQISFFHVVEGFSTLEANQKKTIPIKSPSNKELTLSSSIYFTDDSWCEGKIIVEITPSGTNEYLSRCNLSLLDVSGKLIQCCEADNRSEDTIKDITKLALSLNREVILKRKSEYLPDDKLSLLCRCMFATGVDYEKIENTLHETPFEALNQINSDDLKKDIYNPTDKLPAYPSALNDFKEIYNKQLLSDAKLKTKTKSFSAHQACALC